MPTLPKPFTATIGERALFAGRQASAADFDGGGGLAAGRAIQEGADRLLATTEEQEARAALVGTAQVKEKYAKALDDAVLSGADTAALKAKMADELSQIGEGFQTKRGVDGLALSTANTNLMFDEQAGRLAVQRAGAQAKVDGAKFLSAEGAIVVRNPAYLKQAETNADAFAMTVPGVAAHLRAGIAQGLKQELNQAAAFAAIKAGPEDAKTRLEAGEWDLSPDQRRVSISNAETEIRGQRADTEYQRREAVRTEMAGIEQARGRLLDDVIQGKARWPAIRDDAALTGQQTAEGITAAVNAKKEMYIMMHARNKELAGGTRKSDEGVRAELWRRTYGPVGDKPQLFTVDEIVAAAATQANGGRGLTLSDANQLIALVQNQKSEDGARFGSRVSARMSLIVSNMRASPVYSNQPDLANAIQLELMRRAEDQSTALRKAGVSPDEMFVPGSKHEFFKNDLINSIAVDVKARVHAERVTAVRVDSQAAYDALQEGTQYVDSAGKPGVKRADPRRSSGTIR